MSGTKNAAIIIKPPKISNQLQSMLSAAAGYFHAIEISSVDTLNSVDSLMNTKLIIAAELDKAGYCIPVFEIISALYERGLSCLEGSTAAILVNSPNELNTKSTAADIAFHLNELGCSFIGHSLVEATASLSNFKTWQKTMNSSLQDICLDMCSKLGERISSHKRNTISKPKILALHSSLNKVSNTLTLWHIIRDHLIDCDVEELHVENGKVLDCKGCNFKTCTYFSNRSSCFYGGMMVEEIFPAIEKADGIIWICPNYNDAVSANLTAVINRLTALYRKTSFYEKAMFSVIVSGNSGSDSIAVQLIDALCFNKGFYLPSKFSIMETANDPGAIWDIENIEKKARHFAQDILTTFDVAH